MSKFEIGDKVQMPGVPFVVEVLEIGECADVANDCDDEPDERCKLGGEVFRFTDPGGLGDDWMHSIEFDKV